MNLKPMLSSLQPVSANSTRRGRRAARHRTRITAAWLGVSLLLLGGCGGGQPQPNNTAVVMEQLVVVGKPVDMAMRSAIEARFRQVRSGAMPTLEAGRDVLLLDARLENPLSITEPSHAFRQAFDAGVPILIMHMDDNFERAVHRLLPGLLDVGYTGLALVIPPRAGYGYQDGAIMHISRKDARSEPWSATNTAVNTLLDQLRQLHPARTATQSADANGDSCTSVDTNLCSLVKKTPLARMSIINDFSADGKCLTNDWEYVDAFVTRPILALAYDSSSAKNSTPQCPSQVINFYPVLYLNETVNGPKSRVLSLGMDANLNPGLLSQADNHAAFWSQTYFDMQVLPAVWSGPDLLLTGIQWLANLPHSANSQVSVTDSAGWSLNVAAKSNGEVSGGGSVSFSHSVTNTLTSWKYIDNTTQSSTTGAPWGFTAMQAFPYAGNSSTDCDGTGSVFNWAGAQCHALPQSVRYDTIPDLSKSTAIINGMAVWDLGSDNNANSKAQITLSTTSHFDAVGCGRWSNSNYWNPFSVKGQMAPANDVGGYDCSGISFWNVGNSTTWTRRAITSVIKQFEIDLSLLPIGG
nr:hypothetical protein [uncultured Rhodoferax sp.]